MTFSPQQLSRWENTLLLCFIFLLFGSAGEMVIVSRQNPYPAEITTSNDDDCDGIPNALDATFTVKTARACSAGRAQLRLQESIMQRKKALRMPSLK
ncbi:hypothetical protein HY285_03640 [Candidatus Peregrinibacteria bacterium]|nr:hypothetical protein [Candidatus Peregrinibacteria bacterium]MBI3816608.1 hypothetical protein [Candidatus Peregrinibacteria bacterium]